MITIGQIVRPHGTKGEVQVFPMTDTPDRFRDLKRVTVTNGGDDQRVIEIEGVRCTPKGVILKLEGIETLQEAVRLRHMFLLIERSEALPLPKDRYYIFDLIGLDVVTDTGVRLGRVGDVMTLKNNDVYVVRGERGEILIPATKEVVREIDVKGGQMLIHPIKGLLD